MRSQSNMKHQSSISFMGAAVVLAVLGEFLLGCASVKIISQTTPRRNVKPPATLYFYAESQVYEDCTEELATLEERVAKLSDSLHVVPVVKLGSCPKECAGSITAHAVITYMNKSKGTGYVPFVRDRFELRVDLKESDTGAEIGAFQIMAQKGISVYLMRTSARRIVQQIDKILNSGSQK